MEYMFDRNSYLSSIKFSVAYLLLFFVFFISILKNLIVPMGLKRKNLIVLAYVVFITTADSVQNNNIQNYHAFSKKHTHLLCVSICYTSSSVSCSFLHTDFFTNMSYHTCSKQSNLSLMFTEKMSVLALPFKMQLLSNCQQINLLNELISQLLHRSLTEMQPFFLSTNLSCQVIMLKNACKLNFFNASLFLA